MNRITKERLSAILYESKALLKEKDIPHNIGKSLEELILVMEREDFHPSRMNEVRLPLSNKGALVAYTNPNTDYPGAGIEYEDPEGYQYDLVLVENEGPECEYDADEIRIYVYADAGQEDYTDKFKVCRTSFKDTAYGYR